MDNYSLSVGVIVIRDSKVLLVKHNYGSAKGKYLNPGGYLKEGELPEEAAIREIYEETGVKILPIGMIAIRCRSNEWYMVFKADYVEGEPQANIEENDEAIFMEIGEALRNPLVTDTAKTLIQCAMSGKMIQGFDCRKERRMYSVENIE
ncbi:MAG: NUDIX hydrolase [Lachnospiraceae bacterium]|nr:NUDIX hydrolase [Lachnospiraceae bacterium]